MNYKKADYLKKRENRIIVREVKKALKIYIAFLTILMSSFFIIYQIEEFEQLEINYPEHKKQTNASWYNYELDGIKWSLNHNTAASREFEKGDMVFVTNKATGKSVLVLINDYGPEEAVHPDRELDLSYHAFKEIADPKLGIIKVKYLKVGVNQDFINKYK